MAPTFSSYLKAPVPQPAYQFNSSPPFTRRKRSPSELYYSTYGESEGTPTPETLKTRRPHSRPGFSSDPSSPTFYTTPPSAQVPWGSSMEDSGDESEDVYDQFDLGDFTKEEIKAYEAMVGPGERLRDAAPPKRSLAEMRETSYQTSLACTGQRTEGSSSFTALPRELYELVEAGISNAVERAISEGLVSRLGDSVGHPLQAILMDEIVAPAPQISQFIRDHGFVSLPHQSHPLPKQTIRRFYHPSGSLKSAQRQFEQDVYDLARNMGLSMDEAEQWVLKAREVCSEMTYGDWVTEESDNDDSSDEMIGQTSIPSSSNRPAFPLPSIQNLDRALCDATRPGEEDARSSTQSRAIPPFEAPAAFPFPNESSIKSEDKTERTKNLLRESSSKEAKQVQHYLQNLKRSGSRSAYDSIILRLQFRGDEPLIDKITGLREEIDRVEAIDRTKEGKAARRHAKKARIAELQAHKEGRLQAEKTDSQRSNDYQVARPEEQGFLPKNPEHPPKVEYQDQHLKQKKKGRKRKSELELPIHLVEASEDYHKHKKGRVDGDAQDAHFKKTKRKKDMGPQHSPFFQRSSGVKPKKKERVRKAELMGFQPPMIRPPAPDPPSTPVKRRASLTVTLPPSDNSSPLSSLRSTPSLPSFGNREIESDNRRIIALSYNCARSKPVASTRELRDNPTGLPTPASSPISLRDLNKRLLEGTIYQDGITLAKPEAPATLPFPKKSKRRTVTVSPFFAKLPSKKPKASDKISCIPFPPLQSTSFGLVQERLSHDPFRLLIAVIFLNKTRGSVALPVFYELMDRYPTPADLAAANQDDVVAIIQHLGLQNQRAKKCINLAKAWLERPPERGKRYRVLHYPKKDDGKDVGPGEIVGEEDERVAWEIGQLPGIGVYAIDSWRIFCRDELRGLPAGLPKELTPEATEEELEKEWTRVLAGDKELRAYLRWRWLRNGWDWDPMTGERRKADEGELAKVDKGGVIYEGYGGDMVVADAKGEEVPEAVKVESQLEKEDCGKESGGTDDVTTEPMVVEAPQKVGGEAEAMTAESQHNDLVGKEPKGDNATKDEPESGEKSELG